MADPRGIRTRVEWTRALRALRDRAGLSYTLLSEGCEGTSTSTLQKMVTGELSAGSDGAFVRPGMR